MADNRRLGELKFFVIAKDWDCRNATKDELLETLKVHDFTHLVIGPEDGELLYLCLYCWLYCRPSDLSAEMTKTKPCVCCPDHKLARPKV